VGAASAATGFLHGTAPAMLFSLMAPCGPLYFARRDIPVTGPANSAGSSRLGALRCSGGPRVGSFFPEVKRSEASHSGKK